MADPLPPVVIGLDLSLRNTGIAHADGSTETFQPTADGATNYGMDRLCEIREHVGRVCNMTTHLELVIVEALAFDGHDTKREQAMLAGLVRHFLFTQHLPFLLVAPNTLKKYATGNGQAGKVEMYQAAQKRFGYDGTSFDEADALWLRAIGWDLLGQPIVELPQAQHKALRTLATMAPAVRS